MGCFAWACNEPETAALSWGFQCLWEARAQFSDLSNGIPVRQEAESPATNTALLGYSRWCLFCHRAGPFAQRMFPEKADARLVQDRAPVRLTGLQSHQSGGFCWSQLLGICRAIDVLVPLYTCAIPLKVHFYSYGRNILKLTIECYKYFQFKFYLCHL